MIPLHLAHDSLRFYFLTTDVRLKQHGIDKTIDLDGLLVV
jgi:hypothetical protein